MSTNSYPPQHMATTPSRVYLCYPTAAMAMLGSNGITSTELSSPETMSCGGDTDEENVSKSNYELLGSTNSGFSVRDACYSTTTSVPLDPSTFGIQASHGFSNIPESDVSRNPEAYHDIPMHDHSPYHAIFSMPVHYDSPVCFGVPGSDVSGNFGSPSHNGIPMHGGSLGSPCPTAPDTPLDIEFVCPDMGVPPLWKAGYMWANLPKCIQDFIFRNNPATLPRVFPKIQCLFPNSREGNSLCDKIFDFNLLGPANSVSKAKEHINNHLRPESCPTCHSYDSARSDNIDRHAQKCHVMCKKCDPTKGLSCELKRNSFQPLVEKYKSILENASKDKTNLKSEDRFIKGYGAFEIAREIFDVKSGRSATAAASFLLFYSA